MIKYLLGITSQDKFRYFIVECNEKWDEENEYINYEIGSICVQCPTGCQLSNYRCWK